MPLTYPWIVRKKLDGSKNILDIGCGDGKFMSKVNFDHRFKIIGIDLFDPYIKKAKNTGVYAKVIKRDIRKINYEPVSFEVVHASQTIEHLNKKDAIELIKKMEKIASDKVIIGTPNGHFEQGVYDKNRLQRHLSSWTVDDFNKLGYKCYGQALKIIYGEEGLIQREYLKNITMVRYFLYIISYLFSFLSYYFPRLGAHIIAVKKV